MDHAVIQPNNRDKSGQQSGYELQLLNVYYRCQVHVPCFVHFSFKSCLLDIKNVFS